MTEVLLVDSTEKRVRTENDIDLACPEALVADSAGDPGGQIGLIVQPERDAFLEKIDFTFCHASGCLYEYTQLVGAGSMRIFEFVFKRIARTFSILLVAVTTVHAQTDYSWWNEIHDWDGVTPWHLYMTVSPAFFGPNALPVPELRNGAVDTCIRFEAAAGVRTSKGDDTYDSRLRLSVPVVKGRVSMECSVVPVEFYRMDTVTRDLRAARDRDGKGRAGGDFHFFTLVTVVKDHTGLPDISFEAAFRTASGTQLGAARYTDAPGYHFALSVGRTYRLSDTWSLRPYGSFGFYAFQTYDARRLQDDCLLWGVGSDLAKGRWSWFNQLTGYRGYNHNGDSPVVYRSGIRYSAGDYQFVARFEEGLHDFAYTSFSFGLVRSWQTPLKQKRGD
jgi:hypothetical protein